MSPPPATTNVEAPGSALPLLSNSSSRLKTRITTQNKTQEAIASREIANKLSASKPKTVKSNNNITFTQKDLLLEALSTEIDNTRWLERHK